ncbi:hypothetical protein GF345_05815 [Candidatus Woesearchaeota archaeon]|nr:hypothetical protein [Candidatus Woesearchaeota archaeon]
MGASMRMLILAIILCLSMMIASCSEHGSSDLITGKAVKSVFKENNDADAQEDLLKINNGSQEEHDITEMPAQGSKECGIIRGSASSGNQQDSDSAPRTDHVTKIVENQKGRIEFKQDIDASKHDILIDDNLISVEPDPGVGALLTLKGDFDSTPIIVRDGEYCSGCRIIDHSGGRVVFEVPHFSEYTVMECFNLTDDFVINNPGDYTICRDWTVADQQNDSVILINSSNVSIDCKGHSMTGDRTGVGIYIGNPPEMDHWMNITQNLEDLMPILNDTAGFVENLTYLHSISIKNCNIKDFEHGMNITAIENSEIVNNSFDNAPMFLAMKDSLVENNEIKNSVLGMIVIASNASVRNNLIHNNSGIGLGVGGLNNTVEYNDVFGNLNGMAMAGFRNVFRYNNATDNQENGFGLVFAADCEAYGNILTGNQGSGISIAESSNNTIYSNLMMGNDAGISMNGLFGPGPSDGNIIDNNTMINNSVGMRIKDGSLMDLFAAIGNMLSRAFTGKARYEAPPHRITDTVITGNTFSNPDDMIVESRAFESNLIIYNEFSSKDSWDISGLRQENTVISNRGECDTDNDCDDNDPDTIDMCRASTCVNEIATIYGRVVDAETGQPLAGKEVSIIPASECNAADDETGQGDCIPEPKSEPEAVTDSQGRYAVAAPPGIYHVVVSGSREDTLNRYVGNEVSSIEIPSDGQIKVVVEPERIEAGFHSTAYVKAGSITAKVFDDSHVTQTPVFVDVAGTDNLEFVIEVQGNYPYRYTYNLSSIDANNHISFSDNRYRPDSINGSNQAIIDQLDGDTWRLWFEDLPPGHPWQDNDYDDVIFLIDFIPSGSNSTGNDTDYDCDDDSIPNYLDEDDSWCDKGDEETEIVNDTVTGLYTEGHILYSGRFSGNNRYIAGDTLQFVIFGTNNLSTSENVTFLIEDHTINTGVNGTAAYAGNTSDINEVLEIQNDGTRHERVFNLTIPPYFSAENGGRHDVHIVHNGSKVHKLGDFYAIADEQPPFIWAEDKTGYTNETISIMYNAYDPPMEGTVVFLTGGSNSDVTVNVDQDNNGDFDYSIDGGLNEIQLNFTESGHYQIKFAINDSGGNYVETYSDVSVWITEDEADIIGMSVYSMFADLYGLMGYDFSHTVGASNPIVYSEWDRFNIIQENLGDEYITPGNGDDLTQAEIDGLQNVIDACNGPEYVKTIPPSTAEEFNQTLFSFLMHLQCDCGMPLTGPSC